MKWQVEKPLLILLITHLLFCATMKSILQAKVYKVANGEKTNLLITCP